MKKYLKIGSEVNYNTYLDGLQTTASARVIAIENDFVLIAFFHPVYPEAGQMLRMTHKANIEVK